jgi:hypothetical protein
VSILRIKAVNSHDEFKDSRAMEKVRAELTTRASDTIIKRPLARLTAQ